MNDSDWLSQEMSVRQMMDTLEASYRTGAITTAQYCQTRDHLAARLHDLVRAHRQQHVYVQQAMMQNQLAQQALLQGQALASYPPVAMQVGNFLQQIRTPQPAKLECEDAFGEVIAWRCWLTKKLPILTSTYRTDFIWMPRTVEEAKGIDDHNPLGFHAWKDERQATGYALSLGENAVVGRVKFWGIVIHHEKGYRAQFAKIVSLDTLLSAYTKIEERALKILRQHYGVDPQPTKGV